MNEQVDDDVTDAPAGSTRGARISLAGAAGPERDRNMAVASILAYVAFSFIVPLLQLPHLRGPAMQLCALGAMLVSTLVFMYLQLWMPRTIVQLRPKPMQALGVLATCIVLWALANKFVHAYHGMPYASNYTLYVLRTPIMGLLLTLGLTYLGTLLSRIIREVNVLLPVAFVAMPIDYIGAMTPTGYTHDMVKHHMNVVQNVSVNVPVMHGVPQVGLIGPGDVLFIAFFLAVAVNLDLNEPLTFKLMYVFLTATMLLVTFGGFPIAALIPMGLAVLAANFRHFKLERSEVFASIYAMLIVLVLVVAFYVYSHHHFFGGK